MMLEVLYIGSKNELLAALKPVPFCSILPLCPIKASAPVQEPVPECVVFATA